MADAHALEILFRTYWSSQGWKQSPTTSAGDLAYAQAAGYMFKPVQLTHARVVRAVEEVFQKVKRRAVVDAFLASLSTRRLELRSALGSYAVARHFPAHKFHGKEVFCSICGSVRKSLDAEDLNVLNFERYKWGGVRHDQPEYIAFDLESFTILERVTPTSEDLAIMRAIIDSAQSCPATARPRDLERRLANIIQSNRAEREMLLQILGYCGLLQSNKHPGYFRTFVNATDRTLPPASRIDWTYPFCWWRGSDGVNPKALAYYFPQIKTR